MQYYGVGFPDWQPDGEQTAWLLQTTASTDVYFDLWRDITGIEQGKRYQCYGYLGQHRCDAEVIVCWYALDGQQISCHTLATSSYPAAYGGRSLYLYQQTGGFITAPSNASTARVFFRKLATMEGADSYLFLARPFFGEAGTQQVEFSPWSDGPPMTHEEVAEYALTKGVLIDSGGIVFGTGGSIRSGKTEPGAGRGAFLGYHGGAHQFDIGNTEDGKYLHFDGQDLVLGENTRLLGTAKVFSGDVEDGSKGIKGENFSYDIDAYNDITGNYPGGTYTAMNQAYGASVTVQDNAQAGDSYTVKKSMSQSEFPAFRGWHWDKPRYYTSIISIRWMNSRSNAQPRIFSGIGRYYLNGRSSKYPWIGLIISDQYCWYSYCDGNTIKTGVCKTLIETGDSQRNYRVAIAYVDKVAKFYLNGELVHTATTGLPDGSIEGINNNGHATYQSFYFENGHVPGSSSTVCAYMRWGHWRFLQKER